MRMPRGCGKIERACQEGVERLASLTESAGGLLGVEDERVSLSLQDVKLMELTQT